jgi:hypothetical protein
VNSLALSSLRLTLFVWTIGILPALSDPISNEIQTISESDPNALKLMVMCIGLLVLCAGTLIGVTTYYLLKGKRTGK